jgi:hypothetical protein
MQFGNAVIAVAASLAIKVFWIQVVGLFGRLAVAVAAEQLDIFPPIM